MTYPIPITPEELTARTVACGDCNSPSGQACYRIEWHHGRPQTFPRRYHPERLRIAKRKANLNAEVHA